MEFETATTNNNVVPGSMAGDGLKSLSNAVPSFNLKAASSVQAALDQVLTHESVRMENHGIISGVTPTHSPKPLLGDNNNETSSLADIGFGDMMDTNDSFDLPLVNTDISKETVETPPIEEEEKEEVLKKEVEEEEDEEAGEQFTCGECSQNFTDMKTYIDHNCSLTVVKNDKKEENDDLSDVESFEGRIVYNPDGSAYIIEGETDISDSESLVDLPQQEGSIIEHGDKVMIKPPNNIQPIAASRAIVYPQIANAFYIHRNPAAFYNYLSMFPEQKRYPEAPIMHSYRVYDLRDKIGVGEEAKKDNEEEVEKEKEMDTKCAPPKSPPKLPIADVPTVPTKPILMCFICKLSFGYAKSFVAHAIGEHGMSLNEEERNIMAQKNASAIIQCIGKDKEPLMSFLEPNPVAQPEATEPEQQPLPRPFYPPNLYNVNSIEGSNTSASYMYPAAKAALETKTTTAAHTARSSNDPSISADAKGSDPNNAQDLTNQGANNKDHGSSVLDATAATEKQKLSETKLSAEPKKVSSPVKENGSGEVQEERANTQEHSRGTRSPDAKGYAGLDSREGSPNSESSRPNSAKSPISAYSPMMHGSVAPSGMMLTGCDEHPMGNLSGVECPKCDMVLGSSKSLGGHMTMMHSRNSCKTLKCPKCNWHYKYQETLEIHMKEKHPENESQCIYCITNQPHPRLARGEIYTCGYKPYRCDVCNYSTTTKGNLSIHMQSDKHINNMQELQQVQQNGTAEIKMPPPSPTPPAIATSTADPKKAAKPKPTWRCDVCNYETNVARNLRIHMTSEKHTHNMMVLQQNVNHMQRDMQLHMNQMAMFGPKDSALLGLPSPLTPSGMHQFSFDPSMLMPPLPNLEVPVDLTKEHEGSNGAEGMHELENSDPNKIFQCSVCNAFSANHVEELHQHTQIDRTKNRGEGESIIVAAGSYLCNLCTYKTNLKANFQLHCKTDKHLQRLQLVNHIREGGPGNEWRLKYMNLSNPIQLKCNACDYYTNSIHKLQLHATNPRHETNAKLFHHLQQSESSIKSDSKYYHCSLCNYSTKAKLNLIQHVRSMKHLRNESLRQMQYKEHGHNLEDEINEIFSVKEYNETDAINFDEAGETIIL